MGAQALKRAAEEDIRQVLGDGALRGEEFKRAILALGRRHAIEPFRACARVLLRAEATEEDSRALLDAIEMHRVFLEARLGRDPGFLVAAVDSLHQAAAPERVPGLDATGLPGPGAAAADAHSDPRSIDEILRLELRRAERSGKPLALLLLAPAGPEAPREAILGASIPALRDGLRDTDQIARVLPEGLVAVLPATTARQALRTAERARARLHAATGTTWDAGIAACPELPLDAATLAQGARDALRAARVSEERRAVSCHPERRSRPRRRTGDAFECVAHGGAALSVVRIEDLSIDGALLETGEAHEPGSEILLTLRQTSARPRQARVASRVLRVDAGSRGTERRFRTAVRFSAGPDERRAIAGLLADLKHVPEPSRGGS